MGHTGARVMTNLERCPFCGSAANVVDESTQAATVASVICSSIECAARITEWSANAPTHILANRAVRTWNRRVKPQEIQDVQRMNELEERIAAIENHLVFP